MVYTLHVVCIQGAEMDQNYGKKIHWISKWCRTASWHLLY